MQFKIPVVQSIRKEVTVEADTLDNAIKVVEGNIELYLEDFSKYKYAGQMAEFEFLPDTKSVDYVKLQEMYPKEDLPWCSE